MLLVPSYLDRSFSECGKPKKSTGGVYAPTKLEASTNVSIISFEKGKQQGSFFFLVNRKGGLGWPLS